MNSKLWVITDAGIEEHEGLTIDDFPPGAQAFTSKKAAEEYLAKLESEKGEK